ncbi:helix-turn-helix domain-containing protein [Paenibacillus sp. RC67]|uniref:helix-turn-helix domain-containing protein n=1 Tax=Paenibacillus sp. RC67 TaxID=3039392 RepID=UPI0024ADB5C3|nr:helix-turn-helix domain-containing protein [Paenibacillus sp. RC67]
MKNGRFTYFKRLFLFCILIGLIPVMALGYFSYAKASQLLLDKAYRSDREIVEQTQLRFEQKLKMIDNAQGQITNSPLVLDAMEQELDREDYQSYDKLMQSLYRLQLYEYGLSDVYLVNFSKNWILSSAGKESLKESGLNSTFTDYADSGRLFFWTVFRPSHTVNANPSVRSMATVKTIPINSLHPLGILVAVLPSQELNKMIPAGNESSEMFVLNEQYQIIAARNPDWIGKDMSGEPYMETIKQERVEAGQFQSNQDNHGITYRKSNYNGWIYVSKTNISEITKESKAIGWVTISICLAVLLLVLAASFVGTRRLYSPVRKLYNLVSDSSEIRGSSAGSDEFYWIEKNMHMLMGKESRMRQQVQDFWVHKLLQGAVRSKEITDRIEGDELTGWNQLQVLCVRIDTLDGTNYTDRDRDLLIFAVNNMAGEIIPHKLRLNPVVISDFQVTLLGSHLEHPEEWKKDVYGWAEELQRAVAAYLHLKISVGISLLFNEWLDAPKAFREAKEALSCGMRLDQQSIVFLEDIQFEAVDSHVTYPQQIVHELFDHIKLLEEERCRQLLDEFMAFTTRKAISQQEFQLLLIRLLADLMRFLQEQGANLNDIVPQDKAVVNEILALKSNKEIAIWLQTTILQPLMIYIENRRELLQTKISDQMLALIHQEYDSPLTLESCAAKLNYHPEYISRVFRKETGFVFSDYLSRHRLHMAKKLLVETSMTVTEISERLMYNMPQNFIRYFRKMEGITPKQYRDLSQMKSEKDTSAPKAAGGSP